MELMMPPSSPPPAAQDFRFDSTATSPYATAPSSPYRVSVAAANTNPFDFPAAAAVDDDDLAGNPFVAATAATAPPSPNPFDLLPAATPRLSNANPFDLFQHFTSAPASPARAAAIYAHFRIDGNGYGTDDDDDDGGGDDFQPRASYSTTTSAVPFDWEEKPGTPKPRFAANGVATAAVNGTTMDDSDFEFGALLDKSAPPPVLTTADELFDKGKIRPLKPPPRLHDGGSVGSSPRSPKAKAAAMWSPRRRSRVGSGTDFDPFAAALVEATKSPSPLGGNGTGSGSLSKKPDPVTEPPPVPPATTKNGGRKKWRLSDLLLFRSSSEGRVTGNRSKDPIFKYSPVQFLNSSNMEPPAEAVKKTASVEPAAANGHVPVKHKKEGKKAGMAVEGHRQSLMGCVRLNSGLHRFARGFNGYSSHFGRGTSGSATKG